MKTIWIIVLKKKFDPAMSTRCASCDIACHQLSVTHLLMWIFSSPPPPPLCNSRARAAIWETQKLLTTTVSMAKAWIIMWRIPTPGVYFVMWIAIHTVSVGCIYSSQTDVGFCFLSCGATNCLLVSGARSGSLGGGGHSFHCREVEIHQNLKT